MEINPDMATNVLVLHTFFYDNPSHLGLLTTHCAQLKYQAMAYPTSAKTTLSSFFVVISKFVSQNKSVMNCEQVLSNS